MSDKKLNGKGFGIVQAGLAELYEFASVYDNELFEYSVEIRGSRDSACLALVEVSIRNKRNIMDAHRELILRSMFLDGFRFPDVSIVQSTNSVRWINNAYHPSRNEKGELVTDKTSDALFAILKQAC